jgi:hypothetical protein
MNHQFKQKTLLVIMAGLLVTLSAPSFADTSSAPAASPSSVAKKHRHHWKRKIFKECAAANDITLPAKGSGQKLNASDLTTVKACVKEYHETMRSCIESSSVSKPVPGQPPTAEQKAAFKSCAEQASAKISKN